MYIADARGKGKKKCFVYVYVIFDRLIIMNYVLGYCVSYQHLHRLLITLLIVGDRMTNCFVHGSKVTSVIVQI